MRTSIAKRKQKRPPRQVSVEHVPTPKLTRALRDLQEGRYVEYDSVEAIRADIERNKTRSLLELKGMLKPARGKRKVAVKDMNIGRR